MCCWGMGTVIMHVHFIGRLHYTFYDTVFRVKPCAYVIAAMFALCLLTLLAFAFIGFLNENYTDITHLVSIYCAVDIILGAVILFLFNSRLLHVYIFFFHFSKCVCVVCFLLSNCAENRDVCLLF